MLMLWSIIVKNVTLVLRKNQEPEIGHLSLKLVHDINVKFTCEHGNIGMNIQNYP